MSQMGPEGDIGDLYCERLCGLHINHEFRLLSLPTSKQSQSQIRVAGYAGSESSTTPPE
jgi:hypothetical protein